MSASDTMEARRRRLAWRAAHRGTREMDLLLGGFVTARIGDMDDAALDQLEALIEVPDDLLYAWIAGREPVPADYDTELMAALRRVRYSPADYTDRQD